jgi:hypothetical protein
MVGAASTKSRRFGTAGWAGRGERDGKVYARNRCRYASLGRASSKPGGFGLVGGAYSPLITGGNSRSGFWKFGSGGHGEWTTAVAVAMPQGQSRVPNPSSGYQ